ncbi:ABC transporter permease subunit [Kroppenstedtia sanguinis]
MLAIANREFLNLFKGFKSLFMILFISLSSAYVAHTIKNLSLLNAGDIENLAVDGSAGLRFLIYFLGFLLIMVYSHDVVNREVDSQRIRLLVTKTSRLSIILGKWFGIWMYWSTVVILSFLIISMITSSFSLLELGKLLVFIFYPASITLFLSTILPSTGLSTLVAIFSGLVLPGLGVWSLVSSNFVATLLKYLFPYYPLLKEPSLFLLPIGVSVAMILLTSYIFNRKEL